MALGLANGIIEDSPFRLTLAQVPKPRAVTPYARANTAACRAARDQELAITCVLGEIRRVLRPGGRLAVAALDSTQRQGPLAKIYRWFHQRFPRFVDCRPIAVTAVLAEAGLVVTERVPMTMWSLPVMVALAQTPA